METETNKTEPAKESKLRAEPALRPVKKAGEEFKGNDSKTQSKSDDSQAPVAQLPKAAGAESARKPAVVSGEWMDQVGQQAEEIDHTIRTFVSKNPLASLAVAIGVGFAGSLLMKKFSSPSSNRSQKNQELS